MIQGNDAPAKVGAVMVVGGGVAGMRAAYDLAESGLKVYLVEVTPALGGYIAQLGFMFPTHDCVLCRGTAEHGYGCSRPAISPFFLDHYRHPNIELMTLTEISEVSGEAGDFTVTLQHHPRYVDVSKCTSCGDCSERCPVEKPSELQAGLVTRKAAYKSAPRAVPNAYVIDKGDYCLDCRRCEKICRPKAINLDETAWTEQVKVGAIILTTGFKLYDPTPAEQYGYGRFPNVVTSIQYERLASRAGPTGGTIKRPWDMKEPRRIAWLQCIGSRDQEHNYCSSICCMYATKEAVLAKQRDPGVACQVFMMDERTFSKEYNAYFDQARNRYHVQYTRCRVSGLKEEPLTRDVIVAYQSKDGTLHEDKFDLVVLSVGSEPPPRAVALAKQLGIRLNEYGFCETEKFAPLQTSRPGIFVAGAFSAPKEIAESVAEASGAVGEALALLSGAGGTLAKKRQYPPERDVSGAEPRLGVFVCQCGKSISDIVDVQGVVEYAWTLPGVVHAEASRYACFPAGLQRIQDLIDRFQLNRVVVAACTPRTHEALFQDAIRQAGLNPYFVEIANIRDQCAWAHLGDPDAADRKAKELVRIAVERVKVLEPVHKTRVDLKKRALVIGGGVAGMTAALYIAQHGHEVVLVEKEAELGGNLRHLYFTPEGTDPQALRRDLVARVEDNPHILVLKETEVVNQRGFVGNFTSTLRRRVQGSTGAEEQGSEEAPLHPSTPAPSHLRTIDHGVTIVAIGGQEYRGGQYLFGQHPQVMTQLDLEKRLATEPDEARHMRQVVMIQCVRPGDPQADYCSRTCCTSTIKNALKLKELNPDCQIYVLYKDLITYGFREQFYTEARQKGVIFISYDDDSRPDVRVVNEQLRVMVTDPVLGETIFFTPDVLALSMAIRPAADTTKLASMLRVPLSNDGFFMEAHLKLRPIDFSSEGIFLAGMAHYPKFIEESIAQGQAAAARAMTILSKEAMEVGGIIAQVDESKCVGCLTCVRTCPFDVPVIDAERLGNGGIKGTAYIEPAKCQGCGTCTGECPAKAIQVVNYRDWQVMGRGETIVGAWLPAIQG